MENDGKIFLSRNEYEIIKEKITEKEHILVILDLKNNIKRKLRKID